MALSKRASGPPNELNPLQQQQGFARFVGWCLASAFDAPLLDFGTVVAQSVLEMTINSIKLIHKIGAAMVLVILKFQNQI